MHFGSPAFSLASDQMEEQSMQARLQGGERGWGKGAKLTLGLFLREAQDEQWPVLC